MWRVPDAPRCCFFMPRQHAIRPVLLELGVNNISRPFIDCEEPDNYGAAQAGRQALIFQLFAAIVMDYFQLQNYTRLVRKFRNPLGSM